jgi:radical SAM protein with 4Fe4S-binding SPASM domain
MRSCPNPFERFEIKVDGDVYCCCEGWLPKRLGNVFEQDLREIWLGEAARAIRESVLDDSFRFCTMCPYLPGPRGPVTTDPPPDNYADRIKVLKLDYDQSCNLTCPSCRVCHSSNFVDGAKVARIGEIVMKSGILDVTRRLYVTGYGDPFASEHYWHLLTHLPAPPAYPDLEVFLHTNGILLDAEHWEELGPTRDRVAEVGISVDAGTPETYAINRRASWRRLWDNVKMIGRLQAAARADRPMLGMFYTVQANNFRELIPFVQMAWDHNVRWISVTPLRNWGTYTTTDYLSRAVHLPGHPDHLAFKEVIEDARLTQDKQVVLARFDPSFTDQHVIGEPGSLLSPTP